MEIDKLPGFGQLTRIDGAKSSFATGGANSSDIFSDLIKKSIDEVSKAQHAAEDANTKLQSGDDSVGIHDAMISMQKASLTFQTMTAVRNKVVGAYNQVMQMNI